MNKFNSMFAIAVLALTFTSCSKDEADPVIVVPPSDGSTLTLNGITAAGEDGASAGNSVYVDFSANKQTSIARDSWDLGFYSGSDFKVILNATNSASAIVINKTDLNTVTAADFDPNRLKIGQGGGVLNPDPNDLTKVIAIDDPREASILNKTIIATISATDSENKVYIINRKGGTNNVLATADLFKVRIIRKGTTGYTLQYAKVTETTFKTLDITKNAAINFQFASLVAGTTVSVEPEKANWDIVWTYSMYFTGTLPYGFSDLVFSNNLGGVSTAQITTKAYADFSESDLAGINFDAKRDLIGSTWRATTPSNSAAVKANQFYLVKDGSGNIYKLKFVSFTSTDGGTRGKPVIEYKLIKKG